MHFFMDLIYLGTILHYKLDFIVNNKAQVYKVT